MPNPDYQEFSVTKDITGNADTVLVKDNGTKNQLNFAFGGVFHPWGYNPRAKISLRNVFLFLGLPLNQALGENFLLGVGVGARGFNIMGGVHVGTTKQLSNGYNLNTRYPKKDFDLDKTIIKDIQFSYFIGVALDLDIVGKIFTSIKK